MRTFLENKFPDIKLISSDPLENAKTIEIIKILENYIETPARNFYPFVYFGGEKKTYLKLRTCFVYSPIYTNSNCSQSDRIPFIP